MKAKPWGDEAAGLTRRGETRRALLSKGALAGGGVGLAALMNAERASALGTQLEGFNNVKSYGATGNGSTDDALAIQNCINASAGAAAVYFPPGTYVVGTPLMVPTNTALLGHGALSVLKASTTHVGHMLVNVDVAGGNDDIHIENLTLDGNKSGGRIQSGQLIRIQAAGTATCDRVFIRRVEARDNPAYAFILANLQFGSVEDCHIHDCVSGGVAIHRRSVDVVIQRNIVRGCTSDHIAIEFVTDASPKRISILGNICNASSNSINSAIAIRGGENIKIVGNICRGGYRGAIELDGFAGSVRDVEIADNLIVEAGNVPTPEPASGVGGGSGILVRPFGAGKSITRVNIKDNVIFAPRYHGIKLAAQVSSSVSDIAVSGNLILVESQAYVEGTGSGIACTSPNEATDIRLTANDIRSTNGAGIAVTGSGNKRVDIQDNRILDSGTPKTGNPVVQKPGILVDSVNQVTISGNRAQDTRQTGKTQDYGLTITNPTGDVIIAGNSFTGNAASANNGTVNFSGAAGTARLRIRDNPGFGPWTGQVNVSGAWASFNPASGVTFWRKDVDVTYPVPFPAGQVPKVLLTSRSEGYEASVLNPSNTKFTCRVWFPSPQNPGSNTVTVNWLTEPFD